MHRVNRCTLAGTVWAPTSANRAPAHCYPLPGRPPCRPPSLPRAAARPTRPTIPRAPRPRIRPTARAPALRPLRLHRLRAAPVIRVPLCRHRADPESSSRSLPSGSPARIAPIVPAARRRPHRAHRAPTSASPPHLSPRVAAAPGPWLARTAPYASLFRRMREKGPLPGNIRPKCMLFEIRMATSSPHASISGRNRAIQDTWRANLAAKGPFSRRGARNHAWREDVASAARPFRGSGLRSGGTGLAPCGSGMRSGRTGFAPCGAGLACLPHARPLPSRLCPPPAFIAAVLYASRFAARIAPTHAAIRHAAHCGRDEPPIGLFLLPSCCPRRRIAPTDARSLAPPGPNPRQLSPSPEPTESRPPVEPSAPIRAPPPAASRPAAWVPLRFW